MRKATWGAILLALGALTVASPLREFPDIHRPLGLIAFLGAYLLLSRYPPVAHPQYRTFLIAGAVCSFAAVLLNILVDSPVTEVLSRVLAVASVALPLWLVAGPAQFAFVAAGAIALMTGIPGVAEAGRYVTSMHAYVAALACLFVAARMEGHLTPSGKQVKRAVVASNIVTLTPQQKEARLERIEARYRAGEIPEHKYWDLRQELDSK